MIVMGNDALLTDIESSGTKAARNRQWSMRLSEISARRPGPSIFLRDKRGWMIDDMRSGCYVLSEALQQKSKC